MYKRQLSLSPSADDTFTDSDQDPESDLPSVHVSSSLAPTGPPTARTLEAVATLHTRVHFSRVVGPDQSGQVQIGANYLCLIPI